jgi:hypothetical protein
VLYRLDEDVGSDFRIKREFGLADAYDACRPALKQRDFRTRDESKGR